VLGVVVGGTAESSAAAQQSGGAVVVPTLRRPFRPAAKGTSRGLFIRRLLVVSPLALLVALVVFVGSSLAQSDVGRTPEPGRTSPSPALSSSDRHFAEGERREEARRRRLDSGEAREERRRSRERYRETGPREAVALAQETFPEAARARLFDAERPAEDLRVVRFLGRGAAVVATPEGERVVMQSSLPLEGTTPAGARAPLDLQLGEVGEAFAPRSSLTAIRIAKQLHDGVSFPQADFSVAYQADHDGAMVESADRVFAPEAASDTDFFVVPSARGAKLNWQLRSPQSTEELALEVDLPPGAVLRQARSKDPIPGDPPQTIEIARGEETLGYVYPPLAYDADGQPVPSQARIEGSRIVTEVAHRDGDFRYPILVDPEVIQPNDYYTWGWAGWRFDIAASQVKKGTSATDPGLNYFGAALNDPAYAPGMYESMPTNTYFDPGAYGQWSYRAPAQTYIYRTQFGSIDHNPLRDNNGSSFSRSVFGLMNNAYTAWEQPVNYVNQYGQSGGNPFAGDFGFAGANADFCFTPIRCDRSKGSEQNLALFILQAKNDVNGQRFYTYDRKARMTQAYANVFLGDRRAPYATRAPSSSGWTNDNNAEHQAPVSAHDDGLGLKSFTLTGASGGAQTVTHGCTGDVYRSVCPKDASLTFAYRLSEGVNTLGFHSRDIVDNQSATHTWTQRIDRSAPSIAFSGPAYDRRQSMPRSTYALRVTASDGNTSSDSARRSGATRIKAVINGTRVLLDESQPCSGDSCQLVRDVPVEAAGLEPGANYVDVTAYDAVGNQSTQRFDFTVSCCAGNAVDGLIGLDPNRDVVLGDVTGDGAADVVTRDQQTGEVTVSAGDGDGAFAQPTAWGTWPLDRSIALADYDGDGRDDLMGYVPATGALSTGTSEGDGFAPASSIGMGPAGRRALFADLDISDTADVVLYDPASGALSSMVTMADGQLEGPADEGALPPERLVRMADLDRDGSGDLVAVPTQGGGDVVVRLLGEQGLGGARVWASVPADIEVELSDGDGDGRADLLVRRSGERAVDIRPSTGTGFGQPQAFGEIDTDRRLVSLDVSGDLTDDLVGVAADGSAVSVSLSLAERAVDAAGVFAPEPDLSYDDGTDTDTPRLNDLPDIQAAQAAVVPDGCKYGQAAPPTGTRMALAWSDDGLLFEDSRRQGAMQRMLEAGGSWARIVVLWNKWGKGTLPQAGTGQAAYRQDVIEAVTDLRACGFRVLATLTGGLTGNDEFTDKPDPSAYAVFVEDAVRDLSTLGVRDYTMWNEPNLHNFLKVTCSDRRTVASTAARYRALYEAGYDAARSTGASGLRIYVGELSELAHTGRLTDDSRRSLRPRSTCGSAGEPLRSSPKTTEYLAAVVRARPEPLVTSGVAWHPYQHRSAPRDKTYPSAKNRKPTTGGLIGIAYSREMQNRIGSLHRERTSTDRPRLSTANRRVPALYMTEFGYFNQPHPTRMASEPFNEKPSLERWQAWHSERTRAEWLPEAYAFARDNDARLMLHWQLDETGRVDALGALPFDTGLLSNPADGDDTGGDTQLRVTLRAHGKRGYGKEHGVPDDERSWQRGTQTSQARSAYCALRGWAASAGYGPLTITPAQDGANPANLEPVRCS